MNRFRFAPSPTGHLHIGGARTALYNYLQAKNSGGKFILRIEDTDRERSTQEHIDAILEAMQWLGLDYDEGPFYQTQRGEIYRQHLEKLLKEKKAYPCFCRPEELETKRNKAMAEGRKPKYDGTCRALDPQKSAKDPRPHCIRFLSADEGKTVVEDLIRGPIEFDNSELDDLIIARTDGTPTYNFVVVVDDVTMKMTHVIRGDDHLNNTPRQVQLYRAFGYPVPIFAHIPMILGSDKKRLSKRHGATAVLAYRDEGFLQEALNNYLVRLGWGHGDQEIFTRQEMIQHFDIQDVGTSAAVFNPEKLLWLNGLWIRQVPLERLLEATRPFLEKKGIALVDEEYSKRAIAACREKVKTLVELADLAAFYFREEIAIEEQARTKTLQADGLKVLQDILPTLLTLKNFEEKTLTVSLEEFGKKHNLPLGKIAQPLRAALTGSTISPGIYDVLSILGRDRVEKRIKAVLKN